MPAFYLILTMSMIIDIIKISMKQNPSKDIKSLFDKLSRINYMERGKLTAEYRTRPASDGSGEITLGPYYKLQARENGKNESRRVPVREVPNLKQDIANFAKFKDLVSTLENTIIVNTRKLRSYKSEKGDAIDAKKNSTKKHFVKNITKPKNSSK